MLSTNKLRINNGLLVNKLIKCGSEMHMLTNKLLRDQTNQGIDMSFKNTLNDRVRVMRFSGEEHADIPASVQKNKIFIQQSDILIETGDFVERKMSNGDIELYEVIDPGFHEGLGSIPAGYQMIVKKSDGKKEPKLAASQSGNNPKVFIVHGHDDLAKLTLARFIEQIGLNPIILHEQASSSKTIIEKIESYGDVGYAIVLYTPCDVGSKQGKKISRGHVRM